MKGDAETIKHLNRVLGNELIAISQYFLHARMLKDWGVTKLADHEYQESVDEMKHADALTQRILFLEGLPNFQDLGRLHVGENVKEILKADLDLELRSHTDLRAAVAHCDECGDYVSQALFEDILAAEEEHIDWLTTQLGLVEKVGMENYIQAQMG